LLEDPKDPATLVRRVTAGEVRQRIADGRISGGMIPKLEGCLMAADGGVERTHIVDGRLPHAILMEIFTNSGIGTLITAGRVPD
jgi:acetylglutamate kinase